MNAIVEFQKPRLPFHDAVTQRFGIDRGQWKVLAEAIYPNAQTPDAIVMALSYCKARKLDIFKRPVHIVPMWSSAKRAYIETVWPSISELRTTAFRTGQYAGCEEAEFGPEIDETFTGRASKGGAKGEERTIATKHPEWCRITVVRVLNGVDRRFVGPKVYWKETYAKWADTDVPNDMWAKRSVGQLEKCAEAAALRRAFPEELGNELTAEEMAGQALHDAGPDLVTPDKSPKVARQAQQPVDNPDLPPSLPARGAPLQMDPIEDVEFDTVPAHEDEPVGEGEFDDSEFPGDAPSLIDDARAHARQGRRVFDEFFTGLPPEQRIQLKDEMSALMAAAKTADTQARGAKR